MNSHPSKPARRILHTADLHIAEANDNASRSLETIINLAIKKRADMVIIAGDLFDHNRVADSLVDFVKAQLWRIPIPVVILPGNHDCLVPDSVYDKSNHWQSCRNVHIFQDTHGETLDLPSLGISIWGKPIDTYLSDVRPMENMPQSRKPEHWNIAVAHGYFVKNEPPLFPSYHIKEDELAPSGWDYVALGHIPVFQRVCTDPVAYYCGSPSLTGTAALVDLNEATGVRVTCCSL